MTMCRHRSECFACWPQETCSLNWNDGFLGLSSERDVKEAEPETPIMAVLVIESELGAKSEVSMDNFADRLLSAIEDKQSAVVVGLDPRIDWMPSFIISEASAQKSRDEAVRFAISAFHRMVIDAVNDLVPAIKPQSAFYEQYGIPGILALADTIQYARVRGLVVIVDAKRNDIGSTAEAYANAYIGQSTAFGTLSPIFSADAVTVNPYLGTDSLVPFIDACQQHGTGIFILVKTSNRGSQDLQDLPVCIGDNKANAPLYERVANLVSTLGIRVVGKRGYSSVGAVVGATYPDEAARLRCLMPNSIFLVPGYGAQGGGAEDAARCFCADGSGAIVNSSRSITYELPKTDISKEDFCELVRARVMKMTTEIRNAVETMSRD